MPTTEANAQSLKLAHYQNSLPVWGSICNSISAKMRSKKQRDLEMIFGELSIQSSDGKSVPGKSVSIQLYSSTKVDPSEFSNEMAKITSPLYA